MSTGGDGGTRGAQAPRDAFELRAAAPDDVPAMCATVAEGLASYAAWAPGWTPPPAITDPEALRGRFAAPGFIAHVNADVSAHVAAYPAADEPGAVHLMHLFARVTRQGTGVAAALLDLAVADARRAGATAMRLRTPAGNARAIAFYLREGWAQDGPVQAERAGTGLGLPFVWLRRPL